MTVLLRVTDAEGNERRCDARCHRADPLKVERSQCVCGGALRGIERRGIDPLTIDSETLNRIRCGLKLRPGEIVQLRIGA